MPWKRFARLGVSVSILFGCASSPPSPRAAKPVLEPQPRLTRGAANQQTSAALTATASTSASETSSQPSSAPDAGAAALLPTECVGDKARCVPPAAFSRQLCRGKYPSLALVMFEKHAPWSHLYLRVQELEPVNAYGGPRGDTPLRFGEEVVLLKRGGGASRAGMSVSGASDVDVLRLDGTCATIREETLVRYIPGTIVTAPVIWKYLDDGTQQALLDDRRVQGAEQNERRGCRNSSVHQRDERCQQASRALNDAILLALKRGLTLPTPSSVPRWSE